MNFVKDGGSKLKASKVFKLARETVNKWVSLNQQGILFKIIPRKPNSPLNQSDVVDKVLEYIDNNPDAYDIEIAKQFNSSKSSVQRFRMQHGYTIKKNKKDTKKQTLKRENSSTKS